MSSSVDNYSYVMYNEFEKPMQFSEPPPNLFGFKKVLQNSPPELNPVPVTRSKSNCKSGRQNPECTTAVQNNLAEFAERLNSTANKTKGAGAGNMNVYNKCVFFVNSYNSSDLHDASRILNNNPIGESSRPLSTQSASIFFEQPNKSQPSGFSFDFANHNFQFPQTERDSVADLLSRIESNSVRAANFSEEPIIVSDSDDDLIVEETEPEQELFFVEDDVLKPIQSPSVKPGIYKRISPNKKTEKRFRQNVFTNAQEKSGKILSTKDFQASYTTSCDMAVKTEQLPDEALEASSVEYRDDPLLEEDACIEVESEPNRTPSCNEDGLWHLAHEILKLPNDNDNLLFDREKNELVYRNPSTKKKIIYRIVQPEELNLSMPTSNEITSLGNPSFVHCFDDYPTQENPPPQNTIPKKPTRGRPKKIKSVRKRTTTNDDQKAQLQPSVPEKPTARTRSGRVSKPPQHMKYNFKIFDNTTAAPIYESTKDCDYKYHEPTVPIPSTDEILFEQKTRRERNIPADYRCNACNKIYLGKSKMLRHFEAFPDHFTNPTIQQNINEMSLYGFLVKKVQEPNLSEDKRISLLLNELTDFVDQLQSRGSHLVTHKSAIYFVNSRVAKLLGTPEGHYGININSLNSTPAELQRDLNLPVFSAPPPPRLDYNLSISLDDTIGDAKLNLTENLITSDDSLLRTVDDLVKEGIKNLTDDDVISRCPEPSGIHYDHASDNAVEAVSMKETQPTPILDLSLDLFQFNSN